MIPIIVGSIITVTLGGVVYYYRRKRRRQELEDRQLQMFIETLVWDPDDRRFVMENRENILPLAPDSMMNGSKKENWQQICVRLIWFKHFLTQINKKKRDECKTCRVVLFTKIEWRFPFNKWPHCEAVHQFKSPRPYSWQVSRPVRSQLRNWNSGLANLK